MDDSGEGRLTPSQRYGAYIRRKLVERAWTQADLARRAGLKKQTINQILAGTAPQPSAMQVAFIARALRVRPEELLATMGLWDETDDPRLEVPAHIADVWRDLDGIHRKLADDVLHSVRVAQDDVARKCADGTDPEQPRAPLYADMAAIDEPDLERHIAEQREQWET